MYFQINGKSLCLRSLSLFVILLECHSVNHSFCNDFNQISNAYSFGRFVFITQGMKTIWKFDTKNLQMSKQQQTIDSIFGTDNFETVDTVFWFDFGPCDRKAVTECKNMNSAQNVVIVIGEKIKATDSAETYGYIAYKLRADNTLEELPKSFVHRWGLASQGTFEGNFWPQFKRKGSLIIGSAFNKNQKTLYLLVTEIDEKSNPTNRIYAKDLDDKKSWSEWTAYATDRLNGMFSVGGMVYVVDADSTIKSYQMKSNGLIDKKSISSAKEFFNCQSNSSLLAQKDTPEIRVNDINEYNTPDLNPYDDSKEEESTTESSDNNTTVESTTNSVATGETVIGDVGVEVKLTTESEPPTTRTTTVPTTAQPSRQVSGWLIFIAVVLIIALISFIVLIAILYQIKNKSKGKEVESKPSPTGTTPPNASGKPSPTRSPKTGTSPAPQKDNTSLESIKSVRSDI